MDVYRDPKSLMCLRLSSKIGERNRTKHTSMPSACYAKRTATLHKYDAAVWCSLGFSVQRVQALAFLH